MNAKIINAFGRKEGDPLPGSEPRNVKPCEKTIKLLESFLDDARKGDLRGVGIAGVNIGGPVLSAVIPDDADIRDFAVLELATRMLNGHILGIAAGAATSSDIDEEEGA